MLANQKFPGLYPLEPNQIAQSSHWTLALMHAPLGRVLFGNKVGREHTPSLKRHVLIINSVNDVFMLKTVDRFFKY